MSKTRIGVIAAAGAGIVGVLLGAPLISSATTPDTTPDTGATTTTTGGTTPDTTDDTAPGSTKDDGTTPAKSDDARCRDRGRGGGRGNGGRVPGRDRPGGRGPGDDGPGSRGPGNQRGDRPGRIIDRGGLAELLGVTPAELRTALAEGDSIADIAGEQGVDVDVVIDSLVEAAEARIAERRERINGRLDERAGSVEERITDLVTGA